MRFEMVLSPLDPNGDPKPRRDDERFGGDYKLTGL